MKDRNDVFSSLGLDKKKEVARFLFLEILFLAAGVGAYFYLRRVFVLPGVAIFALVIGFLYFGRYDNLLKEKEQRATDQFVESFTYFSIYISNGYNVYRALEEASLLSQADVKPYFEELLDGIDGDKSLAPFLSFAKHFSSLSIKEVMLSVYQMVDEGGGVAHIRQFDSLFASFSEERHLLERERKKKVLGNLQALPLIGSGITMLALTAALVIIMGSVYNVL
ncbi:MAG: hypothetical protein J6328_07130 [Bacilli bacterium]|nr:hypothetical protein [Bacilli bacterium]